MENKIIVIHSDGTEEAFKPRLISQTIQQETGLNKEIANKAQSSIAQKIYRLKREDGLNRISTSQKGGIGYVRYFEDFPAQPISCLWTDTVGQNQMGGEKLYVVQSAIKPIQRCILMTTDPGDLVLDPTCGSGTTAFISEQWGRRWITIDTSRIALNIAKKR